MSKQTENENAVKLQNIFGTIGTDGTWLKEPNACAEKPSVLLPILSEIRDEYPMVTLYARPDVDQFDPSTVLAKIGDNGLAKWKEDGTLMLKIATATKKLASGNARKQNNMFRGIAKAGTEFSFEVAISLFSRFPEFLSFVKKEK